MKNTTKLFGVILTLVLIIGILAAFGVTASAEDVGESSTQPEVTGVTLSGNGVTFDESTNTYTVYAGTKYVTLTVTGTNFDKLTEDHRISYAVAYACEMPRPYMTVDTVANTATKTFPISNFSFSTDFELKYSSDGGSTKTGLGVYVTYDPSYFISVQQTEGGTISVPAMARQFDTVTVDAVPDEGYILSSIKVLFDNDDYFNEQKNTFSMPGYNVTVIPTFELHTHAYDPTGLCTCGVQADASLTSGSTVTYYATLEDAITAARSANGSTVTLLDDCSPASGHWFTISDGSFTVDLNGKQITVANSTYSAIVVESGNITLTDNAGGGGSNGGAHVRGGGTLTVMGGTYGGAVSTTNGNLIVENGSFAIVSLDYDANPGTLAVKGGDIATLQVRAQSGGKKMSDVLLQDYYLADENGVLIDPNDAQLSDKYFYYLENITVQKGADISVNATVTVENVIYNGNEQAPEVTVTILGAELVQGVDFSVEYPAGYDITSVGTTDITVKGIGSYTGEKTATYTIGKATLTEGDFTFDNLNPKYDFNAHDVGVSLPIGLDTQYVTVGYMKDGALLDSAPTDAGEYQVVVSVVGSPNHNDALFTYNMTIAPAAVDVEIAVIGAEFFYNGGKHTPDVIVTMNGGLPFDPTEFGGTLTYENNTETGTATVIVAGNFTGSCAFEIHKATPNITAEAPLDKVMPGYVMDITGATDAIDNFLYPTTFTVVDGEGYSVSGNTITIDEGVKIGSTITVKIVSTETKNFVAGEGTITLTIGVPTVDTAELEADIAELNDLIANKADAATVNQKLNELLSKIEALEAVKDDYKGADATLKSALESAIATAKQQAIEVADSALDIAKAELNAAIDEVVTDLEAAIGGADTSVTNLKTLADAIADANDLIDLLEEEDIAINGRIDDLEDALADAQDTLQDNIDAAIKKAEDELEGVRADLQDKIDDNTALIEEEVDRLDEAIADANALIDLLEEEDIAINGRIDDLEEALAEAEKTLKRSIESVANKLTNTQKVLLNQILAGDKQLDEKITALAAALTEAIAALDTKTTEADAALKAELTAAIETAEKTLDEAIKAVQKNLDDAKAELETAIADGDKALSDELKALDDALKAADAALGAADEANKTELLAAMEKLEADLTKLITDGDKQNADALNSAMTLLRAEIEQAKKDAQLVPTILVIIALAGDVVLAAWLIIFKKRS